MSQQKKYDLVVLGAGSGGLTAARIAAKFGLSVALLEKDQIGGDCLHTGCVPSKSLIHVARQVNALQDTSRFVNMTVGDIHFSEIYKSVHEAISHIENDTDNDEALQASGVEVVRGAFTFTSKNQLQSTTGQRVNFKKCIIATGSKPNTVTLKGLEEADYLTSDTFWKMKKLPTSMAVIGAGPIGLELGQALAMLGAQVTIFEQSERLLSRFDSEASEAISKGLAETGVQVIYNSSTTFVEKHNKNKRIHYTQNNKQHYIDVAEIMVAVGRSPRTSGLDLDLIGIKTTERGGISVNKYLQTTQKNIYAVGDCIGGPYFTHWAGEQAGAAVVHALFGLSSPPDVDTLPNATFTTPEVAQIGKTKQDLLAQNILFKEVVIPYERIDKAIAEQQQGSVHIFTTAKGLILGALIIGSNASELIGYLAQLKHHNKPFESFSRGIQAYPTYTIGLKTAAADKTIEKIAQNRLAKLFLKLRGY